MHVALFLAVPLRTVTSRYLLPALLLQNDWVVAHCLSLHSSTRTRRRRSSSTIMPPSWTTFGGPNDGSSITPTVQSLFRNKYTTHLQWRQRQDNYSSSSGDSDDADDNTPRDVEKRIRLPNLKYGYRTVPLEWEEIVYAVQHDIALLSRSVTQQQDYEIYKRDLVMGRDNQWQSVLDHVLCTKFPHIFQPILVVATASDAAAAEEEPPLKDHCDDRQNDRRQRRAHPSLEEALAALSTEATTTTTNTALRRNDFPYYMADGLEHWVLWKLGGPCSEKDVERAQQELVDQHDMDPNYMIHWVNPPNLQSLPAIDHVHIIGRRVKME